MHTLRLSTVSLTINNAQFFPFFLRMYQPKKIIMHRISQLQGNNFHNQAYTKNIIFY